LRDGIVRNRAAGVSDIAGNFAAFAGYRGARGAAPGERRPGRWKPLIEMPQVQWVVRNLNKLSAADLLQNVADTTQHPTVG
jgi:hypothetical protein